MEKGVWRVVEEDRERRKAKNWPLDGQMSPSSKSDTGRD